MLSTDMLWILLLFSVSTANAGATTNCRGENIRLSCLGTQIQKIEGNMEINALWKKDSGERVIWKYNGDSKKGDTFLNRTVALNDDLSLSIDRCDQSDQGIYILCINGKPSCEIMLFVTDKQCKPKTTTEQSVTSTVFPPMAKQDGKDDENLPTETSTYITWVIIASLCLVVLVVVLLFVHVICTCIAKKETCKNDKSQSELLHTCNI
ncbi:uncharacterized protein [Garra rufa]|uniref:uncharacterized protein n=1 Tax=Garra rufa TaxID=137080 RepID=UPI003CCE8F75